MALPPALYNEGAAIFDSRPYLQFYQQQLARKQAKEDALDNYFRDLGKNVTPTGMRNQDIPNLTAKTNEWRQFYAQNKDRITNPRLDGGKAYSEYMSRYQDQLAHIEQSKRALKTTDELNKTRLNPQTSFILDDPNIVDKIKSHDLPIGDQNRQDIDIATLAVPPKPWDIKDKEAYSKYLTAGLQYDELPGKTQYLGNFKIQTPVSKQYSDENLRVIGSRAASAYDSDRALQFQTNRLMKDVMNNQGLHDQLNSTYKKLYGKDIETPQELLAAQAIQSENRKSTEFKREDDKFGMSKALEAIRFGHQKQLKKSDQDAANNWVVNFMGQRIGAAKSGQPTPIPNPDNPIGVTMAYEISPDAVMMKGLARNNQEPDRVYVTADNKIMPVFYKYQEDHDEKGKKIGVSIKTDASGNPEMDKDLSKPMDLDQAYLSLGYRGETKKKLGETMSGVYDQSAPKQQTKYNLEGKTYSHAQLNAMGYSDAEIEQAKKAGIIK